MRQLFYTPGGSLAVREVPPPSLNDQSVLVANVRSVISSGTEREAVEKGTESLVRKAMRRPELLRQFADKARREGVAPAVGAVRGRMAQLTPLGYACAGHVLAVGSHVTGLVPGQAVACAGAEYAHHAEIVAVPRNLVAAIPEGVDLEAAAFATLGAIAMQGLRRADLSFSETVVVLGLGLLGLLAVQIASAAGYRVIGVDVDDARVELARQLGAFLAINSQTEDAVAATFAATSGLGADAAVIYAATPSSDPMNLAFDLCQQHGRVVAVGSFGMNIDRERMYRKELDFVMSTSYGPGRYDALYEEGGVDYPIGYVRWTENRNMQAFLDLLEGGRVDVRPLVSGRYPIESAPEAYARLQDGRKPLALVLTYEEAHLSQEETARQPAAIGRRPVPTDRPIGVAVLGAGSFVRSVHLPVLKGLPDDYCIGAIVSAHGQKASVVAEQYGASLATTDLLEVLGQPSIDLALIGTRHDLHAQMVLESLAAGLPVFCEKPLCLTPAELDLITAAQSETGLPVWVGFNRRYSQLAVAVRDALRGVRRPVAMSFRVNAGPLAAGHWLQDPRIGGGRLIGEGCHFFDLMLFLLDEEGHPATPVIVQAISAPSDGVFGARDNVGVTVRFDDGSLASVLYTAAGNAALGKERIEVHGGGASFVIEDFVTLSNYGAPLPGQPRDGTVRLKKPDKGIARQWVEIGKAMRGEPSEAISYNAVQRAMTLTFRADAALRGEG